MANATCPSCGAVVEMGVAKCPYCDLPLPTAAITNQSSQAPHAQQQVSAQATVTPQIPAYPQPQAPAKKKMGCLPKILIVLAVFVVLGMAATCSSRESQDLSDSKWGRNLQSALTEAGIDDVGVIKVSVSLKDDGDGEFEHVDGNKAWKDYGDELVTREVRFDTKSGRELSADFYDNDRIYKIHEWPAGDIYWEEPDSDGDYVHDIVSYKTGEIVHAKNEEKAAAYEQRMEEINQEWYSTTDLMKELQELGYTKDQSKAIDEIMSAVGVGSSSDVSVIMDNDPLKALCTTCNGHQVNFTTENGELFYVQITGWTDDTMGWYVNWRGKLKYGWFEKKLAFDLYDSHTVEGGYIAKYNRTNDEVVPWDEAQ